MARTRDKGGYKDTLASQGRQPRQMSHAWRKRVKAERARLEQDPTQAVCWICRKPIDMALPVQHRMAFTLDHLVPLSRGGDMDGETKPAHYSCNSSRGDGRKKRRAPKPATLLDW